jgi:hypothetical protein
VLSDIFIEVFEPIWSVMLFTVIMATLFGRCICDMVLWTTHFIGSVYPIVIALPFTSSLWYIQAVLFRSSAYLL